jgi:hypothetical protein
MKTILKDIPELFGLDGGELVEVVAGNDTGMRGEVSGFDTETVWIELNQDDIREYPRKDVRLVTFKTKRP